MSIGSFKMSDIAGNYEGSAAEQDRAQKNWKEMARAGEIQLLINLRSVPL
jgi:hypothetical protein